MPVYCFYVPKHNRKNVFEEEATKKMIPLLHVEMNKFVLLYSIFIQRK